jgi:hypothetical protein
MTRKRTRENLVQQLCEPCSNCEGRGYVLSSESMAYKILREIRKDLPRFCGRQIAISVSPRVAEVLLARAHKACAELGRELGREIEVRGRPGLHQEQFEVTALDGGPPVSIPLQWLGFPAEAGDEKASVTKLLPEVDEVSSAALLDASGLADPADDQPAASPPGPEAPRGADESTLPQPNRAASAPRRAPRKPGRTPALAIGASQKSGPAGADPETAAAEGDPAAEPVFGASPDAAAGLERISAAVPAVGMLDLEPETPILPPLAKVEEP